MSEVNRAMLKFPLEVSSQAQTLRMPPGSVIRHTQRQGADAKICLWAECPFVGRSWDHESGPVHERSFVVLATGQFVPDGASYVGTVDFPDAWGHPGGFLWHVFEVTA